MKERAILLVEDNPDDELLMLRALKKNNVVGEVVVAGNVLTKEAAGYLAAEVIRDHFPDGLPDLERPMLWIEHRPALRRGPGKYFLHTFPAYAPRLVGAGFVRRVTLGASRREPLEPAEVATLTRKV